MSDVRTLDETAVRTGMPSAACSRGERRGRYRRDNLIDRHGTDAGVRIIVPDLTADCPQRGSAALAKRCWLACGALWHDSSAGGPVHFAWRIPDRSYSISEA